MAHPTYENNVPFFRWAMIKGLTENNLVGFFVPVGSVDFSVSTQLHVLSLHSVTCFIIFFISLMSHWLDPWKAC